MKLCHVAALAGVSISALCIPVAASAQAQDQAQSAQTEAALDSGEMPALQATCAEGAGPLKAALRALLHYHLGTPRLRTREVMIDAQQQLLGVPRQDNP